MGYLYYHREAIGYDINHSSQNPLWTNFKSFNDALKGRIPLIVPSREQRRLFTRGMTMYFILHSEIECLESYIDAVKRYRPGHRVRVDYDELKKYKPYCSCSGCYPPCVKLAIKNNLIKNTSWSKFKKDFYD